jgi:hypothetical protein
MTYPEGGLRYIWDGRGMRGPLASCSITNPEIRLLPASVLRRVFDWPELVIPFSEVSVVQPATSDGGPWQLEVRVERFLGRYYVRTNQPMRGSIVHITVSETDSLEGARMDLLNRPRRAGPATSRSCPSPGRQPTNARLLSPRR